MSISQLAEEPCEVGEAYHEWITLLCGPSLWSTFELFFSFFLFEDQPALLPAAI